MKTYLLTYYNGVAPAFEYADTLDAARSCATTMASQYTANRNHVLSIVNVATDRVVFYATGISLNARLNSFGRPASASRTSFSFRSLLTMFLLKGAITVG